MPFLLDAIKCVARSHLCSGIWDRSKTVPVRTVNLPRQALQRNMPACVSPPILVTVSAPQRGHVTPFGQRSASMCSTALASFVKIGFVRSQVIVNSYDQNLGFVAR